MGKIVDVEITGPGEWLADFARQLVVDRLAASGNIEPVRSIYRWGDGIEDLPEHRLVLHTRRRHVSTIVDRTLAGHPYEVPGIRIVEVDTHPGYEAWLLEATRVTGP